MKLENIKVRCGAAAIYVTVHYIYYSMDSIIAINNLPKSTYNIELGGYLYTSTPKYFGYEGVMVMRNINIDGYV